MIEEILFRDKDGSLFALDVELIQNLLDIRNSALSLFDPEYRAFANSGLAGLRSLLGNGHPYLYTQEPYNEKIKGLDE